MKSDCTFKIDKLIRDKMSEIVRASGSQVLERTIDEKEYQVH